MRVLERFVAKERVQRRLATILAADIVGYARLIEASAIPPGRLGVPQDMADLIRFLVGPGVSYVSGQTIHVNGGSAFF